MLLALLLATQTVAVLEFRNSTDLNAPYLSDRVRAAAKEMMPEAKVITRENMLVLLQASGKDLANCEGECEVDTARRIGADLVVSGELLKFGTQYKSNMKLHDARSGELLSGEAASGATADALDANLRDAVGKLLAPVLQSDLSARRAAAREEVEREDRRPSTLFGAWLTGGYDSANHQDVLGKNSSGFGWHAGGQLFLRVAGPVYLGGLLDYSLSNVTGPLVAGGARVAVRKDFSISAGFGYSDQSNNGAGDGIGALATVDFSVASGLCLHVQGSWRRSNGSALQVTSTVWSASGGLALNF